MTALRGVRIGLAALASLVLLLALWSLWIEPSRLVTREVALELPGLPVQQDDLRVGVLTDLHVGSPHNGLERLREIVDALNERAPDVVLILGDLVTRGVVGGEFVAPEPIARDLQRLRAPLGVYAVLGNHDWWFDADRVRAALDSVGIPVLEDEAVSVVVGGVPLWLAGVSDFWEGDHDVDAALDSVPAGEPVIVFTHNPDIFPDVPSRVTLTLAGHTHGGQVALPLIGRPVVPSRYGERYAAGHVVEGGRHLFVGTGIGTSILPVRFRVPPEIVIITARSVRMETSR